MVNCSVLKSANQCKAKYEFGEPDKTFRDKTSHAIFWHPGQNIPQRFATRDKTSHALFVTLDITSHTLISSQASGVFSLLYGPLEWVIISVDQV